FFVFHAEDGIRDFHVTGVQTCALPILHGAQGPRARAVLEQLPWDPSRLQGVLDLLRRGRGDLLLIGRVPPGIVAFLNAHFTVRRSEERRVGKESRIRLPTYRVMCERRR